MFNRYTITLSLRDIEDLIEAIDTDIYDFETNPNAVPKDDETIKRRMIDHNTRVKKLKSKLFNTIKD